MKFSVTALLCIVVIIVQAQTEVNQKEKKKTPRTDFGIKAGVNASILSASFNSDSKPRTGFHAGVYFKTPLGKDAYFRPEIYYSIQGQKDNYQTVSGQPVGSTVTTLNYINIPLLLEFGGKVSVQIGPQVGLLLLAREKGTIANKIVNDDLMSVMKGVDFAGVLGIGVSPGEYFNCGIRFNAGLTDIFQADDAAYPGGDFPSVKNRVVHFYLACRLPN